MNIYERDQLRKNILIAIYNTNNASTMHSCNFIELGIEGEFLEPENQNALNYLEEEDLVVTFGGGVQINLTHDGLKAAESLLRKIDFDNDSPFDSTEIYQLKIMIDEIKNKLILLEVGSEVILNRIDEAVDEAKNINKKDWKENMLNQLNDWATKKTIDTSAHIIIQAVLHGLSISAQ